MVEACGRSNCRSCCHGRGLFSLNCIHWGACFYSIATWRRSRLLNFLTTPSYRVHQATKFYFRCLFCWRIWCTHALLDCERDTERVENQVQPMELDFRGLINLDDAEKSLKICVKIAPEGGLHKFKWQQASANLEVNLERSNKAGSKRTVMARKKSKWSCGLEVAGRY